MVKIKYDKSADAAYVYFSEFPPEKVEKTYLCDPQEVKGMINLDFDKDGKLIGIEVMDASKKLSKELLENS
ncbi:MAG: DUF2283 domain-containing protein [Patescibacteria group bacterium]